ncbi:hypothetical protein DZB84_13725 [Bacillus sp. HNG]|uniref:LAGLIDADG family homing endonuclease n=1 Tax=Bacillus sp. HNG TaxID=2293325 RepID=UPI000E2F72D1|nr:LAGLIDADG family homing endonuclease [Bacillus sp. HNG]RFB14965.1 hypothetical protein DZB84_13725 [Bacillus sp. HNG]
MKEWEASYIVGIIDGEGSISLTRMHDKEHRRPCISIASTDLELLLYIPKVTSGVINTKRNYKPDWHKDSYTLTIKKKEDVFHTLENIAPFLRVNKKRNRAVWILENYNNVTPRNGKYSVETLKKKIRFEEYFFKM